jgi:hypothetical protein
MPVAVTAVLQAIQILAPLVEELVAALAKGKLPDFLDALPAEMRSRVHLEAKKALSANGVR